MLQKGPQGDPSRWWAHMGVLPTRAAQHPAGSRVRNSLEASNRAPSLVPSASQAWGRASCLPSQLLPAWLLPSPRPSRLRPPEQGQDCRSLGGS